MNREQFYAIMNGDGTLDYEVYLRTKSLLGCQTDYAELCNKDELQFQLVHQVEELWMKLIAYTLLDIDEYLEQENTNRVLTLFRRIHAVQRMMIEQLGFWKPCRLKNIRPSASGSAMAAVRNRRVFVPCSRCTSRSGVHSNSST